MKQLTEEKLPPVRLLMLPTEESDPRVKKYSTLIPDWQSLACKIRSALRGKLTVVVEKNGKLMFLDTDVPIEVPAAVRKRAQLAGSLIKCDYDL